MRKLVIVALLILSFVVAPAAYGQVIQMKLGHFAADSHPGNLASKMFAEAVEKRTNGQIKITIYANNALLNAQKATDQMGVGRGNFMQIRAPQAIVLMRCLNEATDFAAVKEGKAHFHTVVVLSPEGNIGMAGMMLDKAVVKIADEVR